VLDEAGLRLSLLGELTARYDGAALDLGGPRQRAVLAILVLARGEAVPAERLAESVWGDAPPAHVSGALQSYVSHLRRRLEPGAAARSRSGVIIRVGPGYAVRLPDDGVDAWRFETLLQQARERDDPQQVIALLEEALGLWRGPALADYADEPWAEPEIARLTDLRAVAREQLLAARLASGEAALLVPELEVLVADAPLREERWRLLVLALYRAHRQADALAALRRARSTLADELGVDPGPALRALEAEVLAQSPSLDIPAQRRPAPLVARPAVPAADELVDRDREVGALRRALDDLVAGTPGVVVVEGAAGIGKSRLLAELRRLASERSCRVLSGRGSQLEKEFGFGVVRQLFEPELVSAAGRDDGPLSGAAASARSVFDLAGTDGGEGSFAVLHSLYWLTVNLAADGPLVLAVDDLQWCDSASLRYLAYLARRLDGLPVLVVGTLRTGERHADEELLAALTLDDSTVVVHPAPLSAEATAELVRSRLGDAAPMFTEACHRTTAGNPLLLRQLLRALEVDQVRPDAAHVDTVMAVGSRAVSSMVLVRLRRMPAECAVVARAAAVLGEGASLPRIAAQAGLPEETTAVALAALTRAEILKDEQPLGFVHPLVRDAVYRDLPAAERELEHERAQRLLRSSAAPAEQVAAHLLLAPRRADPASVDVLRRAARTAADRGAADSAVTYLRRALDEPPSAEQRVDVLLELGLLEALVDGPACAAHLTEALELIDDPRTRGEIAIVVARTHVFASPPGVATRFARDVAAGLPEELVDVQQGLLALRRASGFMQGLDPALWRPQPAPSPSGRGHGARMLAAILGWEAVVSGEDREKATELSRFALEGDRLWPVDNGLFWVIAANSLLLADADLGDFWQRARAEAHARGSLFAALSINLWAGFWHWRHGDLVEARACMRACEEQNRMWGTFLGSAYSLAFEIGICLDLGDVAAAGGLAERALATSVPGDGGRLVRQAVARVRLAEGRPQEALEVLDSAARSPDVRNPAWDPWRSLTASALAALGREGEAVGLLSEEVDLLRRWGAPTSLAPALRLRGEIAGSVADLRAAVALLEDADAPHELARARCALGTNPSVPDDEAVPALRHAVADAHACCAVPVRDAALVELRRRGQDTDVPCDPASARSSTERRIVGLRAEGRDVREIAQALFLTPGTVQAVLVDVAAQAQP
jgi:DNA-binding SARP family transcriptional activator/tetratricopeptide (TPR) repeat protein